jgi:hypothetical protein
LFAKIFLNTKILKKKMKTYFKLIAIFLVALFISSCGKNVSNLKEIQKQTISDYTITVLSSVDVLKKGSGSLFIEFRKTAGNELIKVENLKTDAVMQMQGMPMNGETNVSPTDIPGRYEVKYNFNMIGDWVFNVSFGDNLHVRFILTTS